MAKYKQTIVVEAELYQPGMEDGIGFCIGNHPLIMPYIVTPYGTKFLSPGDWIITRDDGERDVCKPDIFEMNYRWEGER